MNHYNLRSSSKIAAPTIGAGEGQSASINGATKRRQSQPMESSRSGRPLQTKPAKEQRPLSTESPRTRRPPSTVPAKEVIKINVASINDVIKDKTASTNKAGEAKVAPINGIIKDKAASKDGADEAKTTSNNGTAAVFLWHYLVAGWAVGCLLTHVAMVVGLRRVLAGGLCTSTKRLVGQTVIVTGANAGIGKETARDMFRRGARVILACRDVRKGEEARKDIVSTGGGGTAEVRRLDLSSLQSVREFADGIKNDDIQVHILINNAGLVASQYKETSDGFELHMGTNHLGPFLLTNLLLPQMKHGLPARIVNLSSCAHMLSPVDFNDFNNKKDYEMWNVYGRSKTANILFTRQLAKVLEGTNIQVFCVHPGIVATTILGREVLSQNRIDYLVALVAKTPVEGAQTTIYCAVEAKQHPEMYFSDCSVGWASSHAKDDAIADKLWKLSAKLVKLE